MNTQRLQQLASFLRKLPPERFDFNKVVQHETECGTVGCAIGWTPAVFPELVEWRLGSNGGLMITETGNEGWYEQIASELFEMDEREAMDLFCPNCQEHVGLKNLSRKASPSQVADLIEEYIKLKS